MLKSKLLEIVKTLDNKEWKLLSDFLNSPYFNKNETVIALFDYLRKLSPNFQELPLQKERAFKSLFPGKKFHEQRLRNIMTQLSKLIEQYFVYQELEKKDWYQNYFLLEALQDRELDKQFSKMLQTVQKNQEKEANRDVDFYFHQYLLEDSAYVFNVSRLGRPIESNLQEVVNNLDYYYLANKLRYYCAILNYEYVWSVKYDKHLLDDSFLEKLDQSQFDDVPLIVIYHQLFLTLKKPELEEHYAILNEKLVLYADSIPKSELKNIYTAAFNYCNKKLKSGKAEYLKKILDLYKAMLGQELLFSDGYLSPHHFRNIVMASLRSGEIDWAEEFIEKYEEQLREEVRKNMVGYCLAASCFYKKEYRKTLGYLLTFEFKDAYHYIEHKTLLVKVYYELDEYEALLALLNTFRIYLIRNKTIPDFMRTTYQNFIKLVSKLYKCKSENKKWTVDINEMVHTSQITDKEWLIEKAKEMV